MKRFAAKAPRSASAQALLENRDAARELFNAVKAQRPGAPLQLVSVSGLRFRTDARIRKLPAND